MKFGVKLIRVIFFNNYYSQIYSRRSQWLRGLRHELSSPARTLGSWFPTLPEAWMSVRISSVSVFRVTEALWKWRCGTVSASWFCFLRKNIHQSILFFCAMYCMNPLCIPYEVSNVIWGNPSPYTMSESYDWEFTISGRVMFFQQLWSRKSWQWKAYIQSACIMAEWHTRMW
jgi:hypothetical protein